MKNLLWGLFAFAALAHAQGTVTDIDGNTYDYLTYGTQQWTVENAAMETYRDGTPIPQVTDATQWSNLTTGAWCYYDNDPTKGKLYNWYAVAGIHDNDPNTPNKEFAPEGWHVPTDAEWTILEEYLIANGYNYDGTTTGNKIAKSMASTSDWLNSTNTGAPGNNQSLNNSSNFNVLPHGYRNLNGVFYEESYDGIVWSSTVDDPTHSWNRIIYSDQNSIIRNNGYSKSGSSVRFIQNSNNCSEASINASSTNICSGESVDLSVNVIGSNFSNWNTNEPNNNNGDEHVGMLIETAKWNDHRASNSNPDFLMESDTDLGVLSGFNFLGDFEGHFYYQSTSNFTWTNANSTATSLGGYLLILNSQAENDFIAQTSNITVHGSWIGMYQDTNHPDYSEPGGAWFWGDGTAVSMSSNPPTYTWSTGDTTANISVTPTETTEYWVDVTTNGVTCREYVTINVTAPAAPTGDAEQTFCNAATVADLTTTGDNIQWYDAATGGNLLDSSTSLIDGQIVYATQTVNGCESTDRLEVTVYIDFIDIFLGDDIVACTSESIILDAGAGFSEYLWSTGETTQTIEVTESGNYSVEVTNSNTAVTEIWINGVLEHTMEFDWIFNNTYSDYLYLGSAYSEPPNSPPPGQSYEQFIGSIDNVEIWNRKLSSLEINSFMNCPPIGNETGLLSYWNFENSDGQIFSDLSQNNNSGEFFNANIISNSYSDGYCIEDSNAVSFDYQTEGSYLRALNPVDNDTDFTVSMWINPSSLNSGFCHIYTGGYVGTAPEFSFYIGLHAIGEQPGEIRFTSQNDYRTYTYLDFDQWQYLTIARRRTPYTQCSTSDSINVTFTAPAAPAGDAEQTFCNAATVADLTTTGDNIQWYDAATGGSLLDSTTALTDGQMVYASQTLNGCESTDRLEVTVSIQDITITASATEVCAGESVDLTVSSGLTAGTTACTSADLPANLQTGLVGYWPFCGNANDESGNGNNGTVNGATLTTDRFGNADSAYSFNGDNSYINNPTQLFEIGSNYSVSFWFSSTDVNQGNQGPYASQTLFNSIGDTGIGIAFNHVYNPGVISLFIGDGLNFWDVNGSAGIKSNFNNNQWYNVTLVKNGINYKMYVDGILDIDINVNSSINYTSSVGFTIGTGSEGVNEPLFGSNDDLIFWNRALTETEVLQLVDAPSPFNDYEFFGEFQGSAYYVSTNPVDFSTASSFNSDNGVSFLTITSEQENNFLASGSLPGFLWLGCSDLNSEGDWNWLNGESFNYSNWDSGEPNNQVGGEDYAEFRTTGFWNDIPIFENGNDVLRYHMFETTQLSSILWSTGDNTANISVTPTETTEYWVDVTTNGVTCREYVTINVTASAAPIGDAQQTFCDTATVADLTATGDNIQWYDSATGGNLLDSTTALTDGQMVYASQTVNGCESTDRLEVTVSIQDITITASATEVCAGESVDLTVSSGLTAGTTACTSAELPTNLQTGLVGYWPFCGNANDESGNGNNGTVNGATLTSDRFGNTDSAYSFDGINDYITTPNITDVENIPQMTWSVWVELNEITDTSHIIDNSFPGQQYNRMKLSIGDYSCQQNSIRMSLETTNYEAARTDNTIFSNSLYHLAIVFNGQNSQQRLSIYVNGILTESIYVNNNTCEYVDMPNLTPINNELFYFGGNNLDSRVNGVIDDIAIWNRALTPSEIQQLANFSTYTWSTGDTSETISVTPTETTEYWVDVTNNGVTCREYVTINVTAPAAPTGPLTQAYCNAATVADLTAIGENIQWYDAAIGGNLLDSSTSLIDGQMVYASQTVNGCESTDRLEVRVSIQNITITASATEVCAGETINITAQSLGLLLDNKFCSKDEIPITLYDSLLGAWPFCGNPNDVSGNNFNGTINGGVSLGESRFGDVNDSYIFDGQPLTYISIGTHEVFDITQGSISISAWVNSIGPGGTRTIVSKANSPNNFISGTYHLNINTLNQIEYINTNSTNSNGWYSIASNPINLDGQWQHIIAISDIDNLKLKLFIDGQLVSEIDWEGTYKGGLQEFLIGSHFKTDFASQYMYNFNGSIDDVAIWNRVLNQHEVDYLSMTNTTTYTWSTGDTSETISVTPTETTEYWVDVTTNGVTCREYVTISVNDLPEAPTGETVNYFINCDSFSPTLNDAIATLTGDNIKFYDAAVGGNLLDPNSNIFDGQVVYASQTLDSCESSDRLEVQLNLYTLDTPTTAAPNNTVSFCNEQNLTILDLAPAQTATDRLWYETATSTIPIPETTPLVDGVTYYVSNYDVETGCESDRLAMTVEINNPEAPTGDAVQSFCDNVTVSDLSASGSNIQWYDAATGGNVLDPSSALSDGQLLYASQTQNGCESITRLEVNVEIDIIPAPILITTELEFCLAREATLADLEVDEQGFALEWYDSFSGGNMLPMDTLLEDGVSYYATLYDAISGCESLMRLEVVPTVIPCEVVIYNAISLNDNGINDYMVIENAEYFPDNSLEVYNRDGHLLYSQTQYGIGDNLFRGVANVSGIYGSTLSGDGPRLPTGSYLYVFKYFNPYEQQQYTLKGFLTINSN